MSEAIPWEVVTAEDVFELLGYRVIRQVGHNLYLEHILTGQRSCIGQRDIDEQWLMGGDWTAPEQIQSGSPSRH